MGITLQVVQKNFADIIAPEMLCRQVRRNIESSSIIYALKQLCTKVKSHRFYKVVIIDIYIIMCPCIMFNVMSHS